MNDPKDCERAIPTTTLAARTVNGYEKRHGYILMLKESREKFKGVPTRQHFVERLANS